jgi:hypothetical protein
MDYDIIGGDTKNEKLIFYTIGCLIELAEKFKDHSFRFLETDYTPKNIESWRGSYDIPAIDYSEDKVVGKELAKSLREGLAITHIGYKGGEYRYFSDDVFYVAAYGRSEEYKVLGYEKRDSEIMLLTKIDKY